MSYLEQLPSPQPVLQIVHVSDLHVLTTVNHPAAPTVRFLTRWARRAGLGALSRSLEEGTAPCDLFAPIMFRRFVKQISVGDPTWSSSPTWLVDTGDQTTYGDTPSLQRAQQILDSFSKVATPPHERLVNLHGNHDAWPDDFPLFQQSKIPGQIAKLNNRPHQFAVGTPQATLRAPLAKNGEIQLYSIDTIDPGAVPNAWARGAVSSTQLAQLQAMVSASQGNPGSRHLRILATHHPVHFPPPRPRYQMVIAKNTRVGNSLERTSPPVHLLLSGHTHSLFPELGQLPHSPRTCPHHPLGMDQCQLVVGTLMQVDRLQKRGSYPHQCQVLRFYQDPSDPNTVVVHRLLAARDPYVDPPRIAYEFVSTPAGSVPEEEIVLHL